jgi:DNA primase
LWECVDLPLLIDTMLKQETTIAVLNKLLGQSAKIRKGTDAVYFCPKCNHYKRKFEINIESGKYACWVCNFKGQSIKSLLRKLNAPHALYVEFGQIYDSPARQTVTVEAPVACRLPDEYKSIFPSDNSIEYRHAINYLKTRNISILDILRYNIGYCREGLFKGRIIIPSYDASGELNFYCGRTFFSGDAYKYKLCDSTKDIVGFELFLNYSEPLTIVEGPFDAIAVRHNCIPLFGKSLSATLKTALITNLPPRVNVVLDNDAIKDSIRICEFLMSNGIPTHFVKLEDKDPSILGFEKTWNLINESKKLEFQDLIKMKLI